MEYAGSGERMVGFTCFQCRISKVKCDRQSPCGRCVRLGVECVSQGRGPGRPPTKGKEAPVSVPSRGAAPTAPSGVQHSPPYHPHNQSDEAHMTVVQGPHGHIAIGGYMPVGMGWIPPQAAFSYPAENVAHLQPQMPPVYLQGGVYGFPQAAFQQTMAQAYYTYAATQVVQGPSLAPVASRALPLVPPQHAVAVYQSPPNGPGSSCQSGAEAGWRSPADGVGGHKRRGDEDGEAVQLVVSNGEEQQLHQDKRHKSMIQRVIVTFAMPQKLAEVMTGCLSRALDSNRVDHSKALAVLRIWSLSAFQSGADFTWGVLSNASKLLTRAGHQLRTTSGWVFLGPSRDEVNAEFGLEIENPTFSWDHVPEPLKRLDDGGSSALSSYIYINGVFRIFANQRFSDLFMTPQECNARMMEEQIMPVFVWARCFNDDGQRAFMETMIIVAYTRHSNGGEASQVVVAIDRSGRELHSLVRVRYVFLNAGNYAAVVLSILPLPGGCLGDEVEIATPMQPRTGPSLFSAPRAKPLSQWEAEAPEEAASSNQQMADQPREAVVVLPPASCGDGSTNDLHEAFIQPVTCQSAQQHGWQQSQFQPQLAVPLPPQADTQARQTPPTPQQSAIPPPTQTSQQPRVPLQQHHQQLHLPVQASPRPQPPQRQDPEHSHEHLQRQQQHPSPSHQRHQHQHTSTMESPQRFKPLHLRSPLPPSVPAYETRTPSGCPSAPTCYQERRPSFDLQPPSIELSPPVPPQPPPAARPLKPSAWPQGTPQPTSCSAGASPQLSSAQSSPSLPSSLPPDPPSSYDNIGSWSSDPPPLPVQIRSRLGLQAFDSTPSSGAPGGCGRHTETPTWSSSPARPWRVATPGPSLERQSQTQWGNVPPPLLGKQESSASECSCTSEGLSSLPQFTQSALFGTMKPERVADANMVKSWSTCPNNPSPPPAQQPQHHHSQPQFSRYSPPAPPSCKGQSMQVSPPCVGPTHPCTERNEDQPQTLIDTNGYQKKNKSRHTHAFPASEQHMEVIINLPSGRRGGATGFVVDGGLTSEEQDPQVITLQESSGDQTVDGQRPRVGGEDGPCMTEGGLGLQGETLIMPPSVPRQAIEQPLELDEYLFGDGIEGDLLEQLESQALFEGFVWDDCGAQRQSGQGVSSQRRWT